MPKVGKYRTDLKADQLTNNIKQYFGSKDTLLCQGTFCFIT